MAHLFQGLRSWFDRLLGGRRETPAAAPAQLTTQYAGQELLPFDADLLERSRLQWQRGDWAALRQIDIDMLHQHPDRAKLALIAAAGHYHEKNLVLTRHLVRQAQDWGCSKKLISQVLISGVHNTLGRAAVAGGNMNKAVAHFERAIDTGAARSDRRMVQARIGVQLEQMGIAPVVGLIDDVKN